MPTDEEFRELEQQLEEAATFAEELSEQVQEKDDLIQELENRNSALEDELAGEGRGTTSVDMREELRDLRSRLDQAEQELEATSDRLNEQTNKVRELQTNNERYTMDKVKLENELKKAQQRGDDLEDQLHNAKQRSEEATRAQGRLNTTRKVISKPS